MFKWVLKRKLRDIGFKREFKNYGRDKWTHKDPNITVWFRDGNIEILADKWVTMFVWYDDIYTLDGCLNFKHVKVKQDSLRKGNWQHVNINTRQYQDWSSSSRGKYYQGTNYAKEVIPIIERYINEIYPKYVTASEQHKDDFMNFQLGKYVNTEKS